MIAASSNIDGSAQGPRRKDRDRRTRWRLRELCEEVLASYRVARGDDVVTGRERDEAAAFFAHVTPTLIRKRGGR